MSDLIDRQDAIDAFWKLETELRPSEIDAVLDMLKNLPSAQPKVNGVGDLISREYMKSLGGACIAQRLKDGDLCPIISIDLLPSAQPEQLEKCPIYGGVCLHPSDQCYECPRHAGAEQIIRCTNCRFFKRNIPCTGGHYNGCEMWLDDGNEIRVMTDDYCSKALPKEGEQDDSV